MNLRDAEVPHGSVSKIVEACQAPLPRPPDCGASAVPGGPHHRQGRQGLRVQARL